MAKVLRAICDLCNENDQENDASHNHSFELDGKKLELDLCGHHEIEFQSLVAPYVLAGVPMSRSHHRVPRPAKTNTAPAAALEQDESKKEAAKAYYRSRLNPETGRYECEECEHADAFRDFEGIQGLAVHRRRSHGVVGAPDPNAEPLPNWVTIPPSKRAVDAVS